MRLLDYLDTRNESLRAFARRSGIIPATLKQIADGKTRARLDLAIRIRDTSRDQMTDSGGFVDVDDLLPRVAD